MESEFADLLKRAGIAKAELARRLGLTATTVSTWGKSPPRYAVAYLELVDHARSLERDLAACRAALEISIVACRDAR